MKITVTYSVVDTLQTEVELPDGTPPEEIGRLAEAAAREEEGSIIECGKPYDVEWATE